MKVTIHPLFFAVGLLTALFGGFPVFIICALTALLHECGHIFCAERLGYECVKISLMPYGAAAECDIEGISAADEIKLALSGPAVNFFISVAVAGLWWFVPQTYAYTDIIFYSNAAMLIINLLPAYPLDGGRVAKCFLNRLFSPKVAEISTRIVNLAVVTALVALYFTVFRNPSLLVIAVFLLCSAFTKTSPMQKIDFIVAKKKKGKEIRYVILDKNSTYKDALRFTDGSRYLVLQIYDNEKFLDEITEDELYSKLKTAALYDKLV